MKLTGLITSIFGTQSSSRRTGDPVEPVNVSKPVTININEGETSTQQGTSQRPDEKTATREKNKDTEQATGTELRKGGIDIKV